MNHNPKNIQVVLNVLKQILLEKQPKSVVYFPQTEANWQLFTDIYDHEANVLDYHIRHITSITFTDYFVPSSVTFKVKGISQEIIPEGLETNYPQKIHFKVELNGVK